MAANPRMVYINYFVPHASREEIGERIEKIEERREQERGDAQSAGKHERALYPRRFRNIRISLNMGACTRISGGVYTNTPHSPQGVSNSLLKSSAIKAFILSVFSSTVCVLDSLSSPRCKSQMWQSQHAWLVSVCLGGGRLLLGPYQ